MPEQPSFHNSRFYKKHPEKRPIEVLRSEKQTDAGIWGRIIDFIEHNLTLLVLGIVGGLLVGLLYTPALIVCGAFVIIAFHKAKVVSGKSIKVQIMGYAIICILTTLCLFGVRRVVQAKLAEENMSLAQLVASAVVSKTVVTQQAPLQQPKTQAPSTADAVTKPVAPSSNASKPVVSVNKPTISEPTFRETEEPYHVLAGTMDVVVAEGFPSTVVGFNQTPVIRASVIGGKLLITARLFSGNPNDPGPALVVDNNLQLLNAKWDRNFDASALAGC
jgi:hypothetical protein